MVDVKKESLGIIIKKINNKEILLPDFQRRFVWTDEEKQKQLISSVIAKIPVGSILLLKSKKADDYSCKVLGSKEDKVNTDKEVCFLLDGQQRMTVLANAFSDAIFRSVAPSKLVSPSSLKRRFFLRIPEYKLLKKSFSDDLFGALKLQFSLEDAENGEPEFLTSDIFKFLCVKTFNVGQPLCYNPYLGGQNGFNNYKPINFNIINYCCDSAIHDSHYLIPLFLFADESESSYKQYLRQILTKIGESISTAIFEEFSLIKNNEEQKEYIKTILSEAYYEIYSNDKDADFEKLLKQQGTEWANSLQTYLRSCIDKIGLNQIVVSENQRSRAIDIYETLNKGGVSLSVFDLVMARVAKVSNENFYERILKVISNNEIKSYTIITIPESIFNDYKTKYKDNNKFNASISMGCINDNDEMPAVYTEAFLNVLTLLAKNSPLEKLDVTYLKREAKLSLKPEEIDQYCDKTVAALDRAMFFFKVRCGIRNIKEINYSLMIVIVSYIMNIDKYFENKNIHDTLEAWYWSTVLSGEFDSDQNVKAIEHVKKLLEFLETIIEDKKPNIWLSNMSQQILNGQNFSDLKTMLCEDGRSAKVFLRTIICQYFLSQGYNDILGEKERISVFSDTAQDLQAHHVIPIGSAKNLDESAKMLRSQKDSILNSPVNFIYITQKTNNTISDMNIDGYKTSILPETAHDLLFWSNAANLDFKDEEKIKQMLVDRYNNIRGCIMSRIKKLIV